jgi:hypothetical protein
MATNPDFRDLFYELSAAGVDFLVVGAHAVMLHTAPRYTKDLDIWIRPSVENGRRAYEALRSFGAPMADLSIEDLQTPGTIFQMGMAPNRIDVLTSIDAVDFEEAWQKKVSSTYGGVPIYLLSVEDLIVNKRFVGRLQDKIDIEKLEQIRKHHPGKP